MSRHAGDFHVVLTGQLAFDDDDVLDGVGSLERGVGVALEGNHVPPAIADVGSNQQLCFCIVDAITQRIRRETAEDHRVNGADARTAQHRDCGLGDQRQINRDAISFADTKFPEHVREFLHLAV